MEPFQNNFEQGCRELLKDIQSLDLPEDEVSDLKNKIINLKLNNSEKVNLIFLGNPNSGKTSSINLIIKYFMNFERVSDSNLDPSAPLMSNDEAETFQLIPDKLQNTYFYFFIESSENDSYKLLINMNESENKVFACNKALAPLIKYNQISNEYQIEKEFSNTEEGVTELNLMLRNIDDSSIELMEKARKQELISERSKINGSCYSFVRIQVPAFPDKYRIVDTPRMTPEKLAEDILDSSRNELFNCFNIFIFVNEISCLAAFNSDSLIMNNSNNYGKPVVYSFYTKGLNFIEKLKKDEKKSKKQAEIDRAKFVNINKQYFDRVKSLKEKRILFRKIIPIIDHDFDNQGVKNCLRIFIKDLKGVYKHRQKLNYNNVLRKLQLIVKGFIDRYNTEDALSPEDLNDWEINKKKLNYERCQNLQEYFNHFDSFDTYTKKYSHHIFQLEKIYEENESMNPHKLHRNNYIRKHMRDAFYPFRKIILKGAEEINSYYLSKFSYPSDYETKKKIRKELEEQINLYGSLDDLKSINIGTNEKFFSLGTLYRLVIAGTLFIYLRKTEISSFLTLALTTLIALNPFGNRLGLWVCDNARKDSSRGLYEWFMAKKGELLFKYIDLFDMIVSKWGNEELENKRIFDPRISALMKTVENCKETEISEELFDFSLNEVFDWIQNEDLRNFIKETI